MARLLEREQLLAHLRGDDERSIGARIVDVAESSLKRGEPVATDFLDPLAQTVCTGVLGSISEVSYRSFGGYPRAERKRFAVFPQYYLTELVEDPITVLEVTLKSSFDNPGHRDFLGAMLATGLGREKLGDLIVTDRGAQAVVAREVAPFLCEQLTQVGRSPVSVEEIDPERLEVEPERVKEIRSTVASMRLDAVAGSGFGTSRTKMVRDIKAERVKLNWQAVTNPAREVAAGDVISIRGRGRVVVEEVSGTTRKGRLSLLLKRFN